LEFDFKKNEIKNSYLNIGPTGTVIDVYASTVFGDSLFISSKSGIYSGFISTSINLADFSFAEQVLILQNSNVVVSPATMPFSLIQAMSRTTCQTIGVLSGADSEAALRASGATVIVQNITKLKMAS
jgi:hypothetical protein